MSSKYPKVTVAIPTYRREGVLIDTIHDVLSQSETDIELIVVDQSPEHTSTTTKALQAIKDSRFRYYRITPPAVTIARNFALEKARAPYIVFLDDDVIIDHDLVKTFLKTFADHPEISAIAGKVDQEGYKKLPILQFDDFTRSHGGYTGDKAGYTNGFPGGNCALRVEEANANGGFDTRYYGNAFREENDMSLRLHNRGYKIYYQPAARLLHLAVPYGGNRVKTHIYDNAGFYRNELFFTIRFTSLRKLRHALNLKYYEYCILPEDASLKRKWYFHLGLIAAVWRILFVKQRQAKEVV